MSEMEKKDLPEQEAHTEPVENTAQESTTEETFTVTR